jgi:hypothetical protein
MRRKSAKQAAFERALAALRPTILARDEYKCRFCGALPIWCGLEVHHVQKRSAAKTLRLDPNNLVTLCGPDLHHQKDGCHKRTDWPYSKGKLVPTPLGEGRFEFAIRYAKNKWDAREGRCQTGSSESRP